MIIAGSFTGLENRNHELLVQCDLIKMCQDEIKIGDGGTYNEFNNGVVESLVMHSARLLNKIKEVV